MPQPLHQAVSITSFFLPIMLYSPFLGPLGLRRAETARTSVTLFNTQLHKKKNNSFLAVATGISLWYDAR